MEGSATRGTEGWMDGGKCHPGHRGMDGWLPMAVPALSPTHHHGAADDAVWSRQGDDGILDAHLGHASLGSHVAQVSHVPAPTQQSHQVPCTQSSSEARLEFMLPHNKGSQIQWNNLSCTLGGTLPLFSELLLSRTAQLFHRLLV